jgi:hypothetical protein
MLRLAIVQQFFHAWIRVPRNGHQLTFVSVFTLARLLSVDNALSVRCG